MTRDWQKRNLLLSEILWNCFFFYNYDDGYITGEEIGFNPSAYPPGSINYKCAYTTFLSRCTESHFRDKGKLLAALAVQCIEENFTSPNQSRPEEPAPVIPIGMRMEALQAGFGNFNMKLLVVS